MYSRKKPNIRGQVFGSFGRNVGWVLRSTLGDYEKSVGPDRIPSTPNSEYHIRLFHGLNTLVFPSPFQPHTSRCLPGVILCLLILEMSLESVRDTSTLSLSRLRLQLQSGAGSRLLCPPHLKHMKMSYSEHYRKSYVHIVPHLSLFVVHLL